MRNTSNPVEESSSSSISIINYNEGGEKGSEDEIESGFFLKLRKDSLAIPSKRSTRTVEYSSTSSSSSDEVKEKPRRKYRKSVFFISDDLQQKLNVQTAAEMSIRRREYYDTDEYELTPPRSKRPSKKELEQKWKETFRPQKAKQHLRVFIKKHMDIALILVSIALALIIGYLMRLREEKYNDFECFIIALPGKFYMRGMAGLLVPLISISIISTIGRLQFSSDQKYIRQFLTHALFTTCLAIALSVLVMFVVTPGSQYKIRKSSISNIITSSIGDMFGDIVINMFPQNAVQIFLNTTTTEMLYIGPVVTNYPKEKVASLFGDPSNWIMRCRSIGITNYMGLLSTSVVIGIALNFLQSKIPIVIPLISSLEEIGFTLVHWFSWYAPIGKFFLLLEVMVTAEFDSSPLFTDLRSFAVAFFLSALIHMFVVIPLYICILTRINPWVFITRFSGLTVTYTSFTTSSSFITIPTTLDWLEKEADVEKLNTRLFIPFGAILNKNGTAIWFTVTAIFIVQALRLELNFWTLTIICLNALIGSLAVAPISPYTNTELRVILDMVLALDVNVAEFNTIAKSMTAAERILDRIRTCVNVYGDIAALISLHQLKIKSILSEGDLLTWDQIVRQQQEARRVSQQQKDYVARHSRDVSKVEDDLRITSVSSLD